MWDTVLHANGSAELVRKRIAAKIEGCARDDDMGGGIASPRRRIECLEEAQFAIADESPCEIIVSE